MIVVFPFINWSTNHLRVFNSTGISKHSFETSQTSMYKILAVNEQPLGLKFDGEADVWWGW